MMLEYGTTALLIRQEYQTAEELQTLLDDAVRRAGRHASEIHVRSESSRTDSPYCRFSLEAEGLSDRSVVYNITLD